jgi:hypothetical protein
MAELGAIGSIVGIVAAAGTLASALWNEAERIKFYQKELKFISSQISYFSVVLFSISFTRVLLIKQRS